MNKLLEKTVQDIVQLLETSLDIKPFSIAPDNEETVQIAYKLPVKQDPFHDLLGVSGALDQKFKFKEVLENKPVDLLLTVYQREAGIIVGLMFCTNIEDSDDQVAFSIFVSGENLKNISQHMNL